MGRASWLIVLYHGAFAALAWAMFRWLHPPLLGQFLAYGVVLYALLFGAMAWLLGQHEAYDLWAFLLPLSLFQVVPDWILVRMLGILVFPDLGAERIGPVPAYMAGLWIAPLMIVVWLASLAQRASGLLAIATALAASLAIFGAAEWAARPLSMWVARDVQTVHGVALYVLPAEMVLGLATWAVYRVVESGNWLSKIVGAAGVSMLYTGALILSFFAVERMT